MDSSGRNGDVWSTLSANDSWKRVERQEAAPAPGCERASERHGGSPRISPLAPAAIPGIRTAVSFPHQYGSLEQTAHPFLAAAAQTHVQLWLAEIPLPVASVTAAIPDRVDRVEPEPPTDAPVLQEATPPQQCVPFYFHHFNF